MLGAYARVQRCQGPCQVIALAAVSQRDEQTGLSPQRSHNLQFLACRLLLHVSMRLETDLQGGCSALHPSGTSPAPAAGD